MQSRATIISSHCGIIGLLILVDVSSVHSALSYNKDVADLNICHTLLVIWGFKDYLIGVVDFLFNKLF